MHVWGRAAREGFAGVGVHVWVLAAREGFAGVGVHVWGLAAREGCLGRTYVVNRQRVCLGPPIINPTTPELAQHPSPKPYHHLSWHNILLKP